MTSSLLNLLTLTTLVAYLCSSTVALANPAPNAHALSNINHARHNILAAKHKRSNTTATCKHRPSSTAHPAPISSTHSSSSHKASATSAPKVVTTNSGNTSPSTGSTGSPGKSGGSGKKGLAWDAGDINQLYENFNLPQISGMYTWTAHCPPQASKVPYGCFPMLWNGASDKVAAFDAVAAKLDSEYYMGFNECNEPGQCAMSPSQAIPVWKAHLAPLRSQHGKKLVCPVTSSNPNGFTWVQNFFNQCGSACDCDVIALHFYDTTADKFKAYVQKWHNEWPNLPIWVTEFNCVNFNNDGQGQPSYSEVKAFFEEVVDWMEQPQQSYIKKYFAYGLTAPPGGGLADYTGLVTSDINLNELGHIFMGN